MEQNLSTSCKVSYLYLLPLFNRSFRALLHLIIKTNGITIVPYTLSEYAAILILRHHLKLLFIVPEGKCFFSNQIHHI